MLRVTSLEQRVQQLEQRIAELESIIECLTPESEPNGEFERESNGELESEPMSESSCDTCSDTCSETESETVTVRPTRKVREMFSEEEDRQLCKIVDDIIGSIGTRKLKAEHWRIVSRMMGNRTVKQCKNRWTLILDPTINRTPWLESEDKFIMEQYRLNGAKWTDMSIVLDHRTPMQIRQRWEQLRRVQ